MPSGASSLKTRIVHCNRDGRPGAYANVAFDFLGYTFQPRRAKNRKGECFVGFLPAISAKAARAIRTTIREWRLASTRNNQSLEDLAHLVNPVVRGWWNYYGRALAGAHRATGLHALCPVAARREAGGWIVGAG